LDPFIREAAEINTLLNNKCLTLVSSSTLTESREVPMAIVVL
jgi:hypothetical protein